MSRHSYGSSCQLDLHEMLHKTVLFSDDKLKKKQLETLKKRRLTLVLTAEKNNTIPVQSITLKLGAKKQQRHFFLQSVGVKYRKRLLVACLYVFRNPLQVAAL